MLSCEAPARKADLALPGPCRHLSRCGVPGGAAKKRGLGHVIALDNKRGSACALARCGGGGPEALLHRGGGRRGNRSSCLRAAYRSCHRETGLARALASASYEELALIASIYLAAAVVNRIVVVRGEVATRARMLLAMAI